MDGSEALHFSRTDKEKEGDFLTMNMNHGKLFVMALATLLTLTVLVAGCGGQSGGESQDNAGKTQAKKGGRTGVETRIAIGRVAVVGPERRLVVRSSAGDQDKKRLVFGVAKKAKITLDGKEVTLEDAKQGQQAQVKYFVKNDRNRAIEVVLFRNGSSPGSGGTTG